MEQGNRNIRLDASLTHVLAVALSPLDDRSIQHETSALLDAAANVAVELANEKVAITVDSGDVSIYRFFCSLTTRRIGYTYPVSTAPGLK